LFDTFVRAWTTAAKAGGAVPLWLRAATTDMAGLDIEPAPPATVVIGRDGLLAGRAASIRASHGSRCTTS